MCQTKYHLTRLPSLIFAWVLVFAHNYDYLSMTLNFSFFNYQQFFLFTLQIFIYALDTAIGTMDVLIAINRQTNTGVDLRVFVHQPNCFELLTHNPIFLPRTCWYCDRGCSMWNNYRRFWFWYCALGSGHMGLSGITNCGKSKLICSTA